MTYQKIAKNIIFTMTLVATAFIYTANAQTSNLEAKTITISSIEKIGIRKNAIILEGAGFNQLDQYVTVDLLIWEDNTVNNIFTLCLRYAEKMLDYPGRYILNIDGIFRIDQSIYNSTEPDNLRGCTLENAPQVL